MLLMNDWRPALAQFCGQMLSYAAKEYTSARLHPGVTQQPATERPEGCPYCTIAKCANHARMYLERASKRTELTNLYRLLAQLQVGDARTVLNGVQSDFPRVHLQAELDTLHQALTTSLTPQQCEGLVARVSAVSEFALEMAERESPGLAGSVTEGQ